ncbi:MAG: alpha/beta fold hydrolase [Chlorobi bacterium]|nr:alpha/beta fold hydrolase [Chlorobiota bacterium]
MKLFYRKFGEGPTLIIIHGLYGASDNWVSIGKMLASNFEVFIIDQRNHGRSPHSENHNYKLMKNDLLEFMDEHFIEQAIIMGHSMGGKTAMYFALEHPERILSLIIIDIAPKTYNISEKKQNTIDHSIIINSMMEVDFSNISSREEVDNKLCENIPSKKVRQFLLKNLHRNKDNSFEWSINIKALQEHMNVILEGIDERKIADGKEITGFPILFIKGALSNYIEEKDYTAIRAIFPYADIKIIENAGHWLHAEQPEKLVRIIKEFVLE